MMKIFLSKEFRGSLVQIERRRDALTVVDDDKRPEVESVEVQGNKNVGSARMVHSFAESA